MAKAKTKRAGYDREVTVGDKGRMSWAVCGLELIYFGTKSGLNLAVVRDGQEAMLCFCKSLDEAGRFTPRPCAMSAPRSGAPGLTTKRRGPR